MRKKLNDLGHLFKLDPAKEITDTQLSELAGSLTDGFILGGTDNITADNVIDLYLRTSEFDLPIFLEVSTIKAVVPGFDAYFIPIVFNSRDKKWFLDIHHEAIKTFYPYLDIAEMIIEGYCIFNDQSKVYQKTACYLPTKEDARAYAYMAEHFYKLPVLYAEYSGMYGDEAIVQVMKEELNETRLFYGGGIDSYEKAKAMKDLADTIVVGNVIYENFEAALETTKVNESNL